MLTSRQRKIFARMETMSDAALSALVARRNFVGRIAEMADNTILIHRGVN